MRTDGEDILSKRAKSEVLKIGRKRKPKWWSDPTINEGPTYAIMKSANFKTGAGPDTVEQGDWARNVVGKINSKKKCQLKADRRF